MAKRWQKVELNYLKKHAGSKSIEELAERFHTDAHTLEQKLKEMRLDAAGTRAASEAEEQAMERFEKGLEALYAGKWKKAHGLFEEISEADGDLGDVRVRARQYAAIAGMRSETADVEHDPYTEAVFEKNRGNYDEALSKSVAGGRAKRDPRFAYLAAVASTLQGDLAKGASHLETAIELDPSNRAHARHDPDLADLRSEEDYAPLFSA